MSKQIDLSVIVPMYNEQEVIDIFFKRITEIMTSLSSYTYEIVCVDDGSKDNTYDILKQYAKTISGLKSFTFPETFTKNKHC